jgi:hypothetical protein
MEENIEYKNYLEYVISELVKINSPGSILVLRKINEKTSDDIIELSKMVEFIYITEKIQIPLYWDWFKYIKK